MREILWCLGLRGGRCNPGVAPHEGGLILREHLNFAIFQVFKSFCKIIKDELGDGLLQIFAEEIA